MRVCACSRAWSVPELEILGGSRPLSSQPKGNATEPVLGVHPPQAQSRPHSPSPRGNLRNRNRNFPEEDFWPGATIVCYATGASAYGTLESL